MAEPGILWNCSDTVFNRLSVCAERRSEAPVKFDADVMVSQRECWPLRTVGHGDPRRVMLRSSNCDVCPVERERTSYRSSQEQKCGLARGTSCLVRSASLRSRVRGRRYVHVTWLVRSLHFLLKGNPSGLHIEKDCMHFAAVGYSTNEPVDSLIQWCSYTMLYSVSLSDSNGPLGPP